MRFGTLLVAATMLVTVSCGSGESTSGIEDSPETTEPVGGVDLTEKDFEDLTGQAEVVVQARDNTFIPGYIEVSPGTTVTFRNVGRTEHNVIPVEDGAFEPIEATEFEPKAAVEMTFESEGTYPYPYYCSLHGTTTKGMVGAVRVVAD